jgi:hypothetical protein
MHVDLSITKFVGKRCLYVTADETSVPSLGNVRFRISVQGYFRFSLYGKLFLNFKLRTYFASAMLAVVCFLDNMNN